MAEWRETRFHTGCEPGPARDVQKPASEIATETVLSTSPLSAFLEIEIDAVGRPILGTGFNLEHALWSCPRFRPLLRSRLLGSLQPAFIRLDTGLLPAAPAEVPAEALGPEVYQSVLASEAYAQSWPLFRRLRRFSGRLLLGVWGGPEQFTREKTRLGLLEPGHYDDYVSYIVAMIDFIVRRQKARIWAMSIANEPEGNDGNRIPPDGVAYIARRLAPRLAEYGVRLYGPDTGSAVSALEYLPDLLSDPVVLEALACVGFHRYRASDDVAQVVEFVRAVRRDLPVIITEYTSFSFGNPDDGLEVSDALGFTLEILKILLSHLQNGVDAALYWDAVDYLQPGKGVITRWGLLRAPEAAFEPRIWYYGFRQVLPYLLPGASVLPCSLTQREDLTAMAVRGLDGRLAIFAINAAARPVDVSVQLNGARLQSKHRFAVVRTDADSRAAHRGWIQLHGRTGLLRLQPRSVTTLVGPDATDGVSAPRN